MLLHNAGITANNLYSLCVPKWKSYIDMKCFDGIRPFFISSATIFYHTEKYLLCLCSCAPAQIFLKATANEKVSKPTSDGFSTKTRRKRN